MFDPDARDNNNTDRYFFRFVVSSSFEKGTYTLPVGVELQVSESRSGEQKESEGLRVPQQERSRETLGRMAAAAERLLGERPFREITVEEIAGRAGVSKGAFYARFDSKDALLHYLGRSRFRTVLEDWSSFLSTERWQQRPLRAFSDAFVERVLGIYREHEAVMREFVRRARLEPEPEVRERGRRLNEHVLEGVRSVLADHPESLDHPAPERAVRHGVDLVRATVADRVLFSSDPGGGGGGNDAFEAEVARALRRYWGIE